MKRVRNTSESNFLILREPVRKTTGLLLAFIVLFLVSGCGGLRSQPQSIHSSAPVHLNLTTFDSGFGGFFTAKSMADQAVAMVQKYNVAIVVTHYGDTKNAPYGSKPPAEIARLTQRGVEKALRDKASVVVIACNTASTQHHAVVQNIDDAYADKKDSILSIITPTISAVKKSLDAQLLSSDQTVIALFATPATVKSMTYPTKLADSYHAELEHGAIQEFERYDWKDPSRHVTNVFSSSLIRLPKKKTIFIYQFAPGNWVSMIEEGAPDALKQQVVREDIGLFFERVSPDHKPDSAGLFCTHYPVFKDIIKNEMTRRGYARPSTQYIEQGALAATYAYETLSPHYADHVRDAPLSEQELKQLSEQAKPKIVISGENVEQTTTLVKTIFPELKNIIIVKEPFEPAR